MAFPLKKKKEESTNEKIIRLHQEGKTVEEICAELDGLRNPMEIVTGVIQRKLGADAVPDAVVQHEKNHAAEVIAATKAADEEPEAPAEEAASDAEFEGLSKLERYMLEKKRKQEAENAKADAEPEPEPEPEPITEPEPEPVVEPEIVETPVAEPVEVPDLEIPVPEVHKVSLVDEYLKQNNLTEETAAAASMESIPSPFPGEEYAVMDALVPPDVESADISDIPIVAYTPPAEEEDVEEDPISEPPVEEASAEMHIDLDSGNASKVADKMKAFALSQIEANNAKIAELEAKKNSIDGDFTAKLDEANNALMASQMNYDVSETRLNEAYSEIEKAREEHRLAIAKADDEYRHKLEEIEEQYRNATFEANNKFQEFDDKSKENIERLDNEKNAAQEDLNAKRAAVAELRTTIEAEAEKIGEQIKALEEENAGYQSFLG